MSRSLWLLTLALATAVSAQQWRLSGTLDAQLASHESGYCYTIPMQTPLAPDTSLGAVSILRLFEDDRELGPAHSLHQLIRDLGQGRFSHWSGDPSGEPQMLFFSASDNSDPRSNGRVYRWEAVLDGQVVRDALHVGLVDGHALQPPLRPGWHVAVRLARTFRPFLDTRPVVDLQGMDASGRPLPWRRRVVLTPGEWVSLGAFGNLPPALRALRATLPVQIPDAEGRPLVVQFALPSTTYRPLHVTGEAWEFRAEGPWRDLPDPRGLRGMRYPWRVSKTGEYAELSREVTVPAEWQPPYALTFFCSDDYTDDGSRPAESANSVDAYPGHRYKQVLVNDTVVWEADITDNSVPGAPTDFAVDLTPHVRPGQAFRLSLRNFDGVGLNTPLPTDFYLRGVYEGDRPEGEHVLATTCYWGDVTLWQGSLTEGPAWPRPSSATVNRVHATRWPLPPAGQRASLPVALRLEGIAQTLRQNTPVICGLPLPQGVVRSLKELSLRLGREALPWQPEVMNTWPDGSLRWVMANTVLPAGTEPTAQLRLSAAGVAETPAPPAPVTVRVARSLTTAATGDLHLSTTRHGQNLLRDITWDGRGLLHNLRLTASQVLADGQVRTLATTWQSVKPVRQGPVRATLEAHGTLGDASGDLGPVVCRLDLFAGSPALRLTCRLFNAGAERADLTSVRLTADLGLGPRRWSVCSAGAVDGPDLRLAHSDAEQYTLTTAGTPQTSQGRAEGWIATGDGERWVQAAVRHFWQQFPAAMAVTPETLQLDLVAADAPVAAYGCRAGEAKRWEVWLNFGSGPADADALAQSAQALLRPIRLFDAAYFCASEGLGRARPHDGEFAPVRHHMAQHYPEANYASMALLFGLRDFGDGYYTQATPTYRNNYYDVMRGLFGEYLMGGGAAWFDRGEEAARHYMDIDQFHDSVRSHEQMGANASVYTPNHNDEFGIWAAMLRPAGGMLTYWRLSGDEDARESALMLADYIVRTEAGRGAGSVRDNAGPLHSLVWAYDETRDPRYLKSALALADSVRQRLIPRRGCYAECHGSNNYRGNVPWMVAQLCEPLEMLYWQSGETWVADMMVGLMESVVAENMEPGTPGNFQGYTHDPVLHRDGWQSGYNVLIAPCVGLAYELSGDERLKEVMYGAYRLTVEQKTINDVRNCYWMTPMLLYLLDRYH
ncbi:MAG: hypothetical protein HPY69_05605 [Armatimonadetes bacterium]|nr:hypothetical protein [Armatimonadota bacterium]